jgi:serine/threonine-protein kinase
MPPIPQKIGRYDIIELVGRGGMGVLYRAHDPTLERDVALKMMLVDFTLDPAARDRFGREAKAVARLQHRNIVTIHELGEFDGTPFIVMEFLSGKDLEDRLKVEPALTLTEKLDAVIQLCEGLGYAHEQGIVHRDIKPGNVRVLEDTTIKILDFGIARFATSSVTQSGTVMGTASYMAPEQIMGQPVDGRADLFSVGVLLHEILTGEKPFAADSPTAVVYQIMHVDPPGVRTIKPELPEALDEIVGRALKKHPDERYSRASEMAADLQMVKMMIDLPMRADDGGVGGGTGKLHTPIKSGTGAVATVVMRTPMRGSAVAAAADAAPAQRALQEKSGPPVMWIGGGVAVLVVAAIAFFAMRGNGPAPAPAGTPATTTAGAPTPGTAAGGSKNGGRAAAHIVAISSVPTGAKVELDGADTGKVTPAAVELPDDRAHKIQLSMKGYATLSSTLAKADVDAGSKEYTLSREAGAVHLTVSADFPFEIVQGSRVLSEAAAHHEVTIQPGNGSVVARSKDVLLKQTLSIDFKKDQQSVTLPALGTVAVFSAVETCTVTADGEDLGFPPIANKKIAAGAHTFGLKCPDGKAASQQVTVTSGQRTPVSFGPPKN